MNRPPLQLDVDVRMGSPAPKGAVRFHNAGSAEVRIWQTGNAWGDAAQWFEVVVGDESWRVVRRQQVYTRNVPSSIAIAPGVTHDRPFDLGDAEWRAEPPREQLAVPGARLVAVYHAPVTPEAIAAGVWTGEVRSPSTPVEEAAG